MVTIERSPGCVHGMTANSFVSVSLEPPLVSICVDRNAHLLPLIKEKRRFGINVLKEHQQALSEFFSRPEQSEKEEADLDVRFRWTEDGIPLLEEVLCQISCRLWTTHVAGDHTIVLTEVLQASLYDGQPLLFFRGQYTRLFA